MAQFTADMLFPGEAAAPSAATGAAPTRAPATPGKPQFTAEMLFGEAPEEGSPLEQYESIRPASAAYTLAKAITKSIAATAGAGIGGLLGSAAGPVGTVGGAMAGAGVASAGTDAVFQYAFEDKVDPQKVAEEGALGAFLTPAAGVATRAGAHAMRQAVPTAVNAAAKGVRAATPVIKTLSIPGVERLMQGITFAAGSAATGSLGGGAVALGTGAAARGLGKAFQGLANNPAAREQVKRILSATHSKLMSASTNAEAVAITMTTAQALARITGESVDTMMRLFGAIETPETEAPEASQAMQLGHFRGRL